MCTIISRLHMMVLQLLVERGPEFVCQSVVAVRLGPPRENHCVPSSSYPRMLCDVSVNFSLIACVA